ncbi:MAG: hemolysin family protein [Bifidobacteriaceae bacterium]|jgi:CBS domain containing-hemolysin-like protein|nr:hemolysin family protein [Bifidobacteriaceae bacterium]
MSVMRGLATVIRPLARALDAVERRAALAGLADDPPAGDAAGAAHAREVLLDIVDDVAEADGIDQTDRDMIHSVIELGDTMTREVMVPRTAMVTIAAPTPLRKTMSLFLRSGHSRVPVIGTSADDVRGVAYLKDVALALQRDPGARESEVAGFMRNPVFVPESKPVDNLLRELQRLGTHIAIVVDEYGGVAGLVTVEDILEEIVGELVDEHDPASPTMEDLGGGVYRVPATVSLDELSEAFGRDISDDAVDTVGGLLATALGRVPIVGAQGTAQGVEMTAERAEGRRKQISTILVRDATKEER